MWISIKDEKSTMEMIGAYWGASVHFIVEDFLDPWKKRWCTKNEWLSFEQVDWIGYPEQLEDQGRKEKWGINLGRTEKLILSSHFIPNLNLFSCISDSVC